MSAAAEVPEPPQPFDARDHVLPAGSILHRVHHRRRAANTLNPGRGAPTRFAPLWSPAASGAPPIPTLYAAASAEAAVCESLLHDVPVRGGLLPAASYAAHVQTTLELQRELRPAQLMGDGLRRLGASPQQLTATNADVYDSTVHWAAAAHAAGFDGLAWMSARDNTSEAFALFGDRVDPADLVVADAGIGPFSPGGSGFAWLSTYCSRVKVELLFSGARRRRRPEQAATA